jgi:flagellar hook-basal body complex protein FliE
MTVTPLEPDLPLPGAAPAPAADFRSFGETLTRALAFTGEALRRADASEHAFIHGKGGLQEMMVERAQADVALSVAAAAASRAAQAVSTILGMQV